MKTIITDIILDNELFNITDNDKVIYTNDCKNNCIGCFSCWIKHPKYCIYKDDYSNIVDYLKNSNELIIVSESRYGCYSESVKKVFERCIGYVLPFFTIRNKHIHHKSRYSNKLKFSTFFYGNISDNDKKCLYNLVKANSINLNASNFEVNYIKEEDYVHTN